jgi:transposase-like protein
MSTSRVTPFHCPYCGDENLYPREDGWECRSCLRAFSVTFLGQLRRPGHLDELDTTLDKLNHRKGGT